MRSARPRYRGVVLVCDRLYRLLHGLDAPTSEVGPALRVEVGRSWWTRTLADGTRVRRGDRIGILHLNNDRIAGLHGDGIPSIAVGLEFRRQLLASLRSLAALARPGGPLADIPAFAATTIFHQGLARLGFVPEPDGLVFPSLVAAYQRALLASLHPAGGVRLRRPAYRRARRLWMSREALLARFGQDAPPPPQVERTS